MVTGHGITRVRAQNLNIQEDCNVPIVRRDLEDLTVGNQSTIHSIGSQMDQFRYSEGIWANPHGLAGKIGFQAR